MSIRTHFFTSIQSIPGLRKHFSTTITLQLSISHRKVSGVQNKITVMQLYKSHWQCHHDQEDINISSHKISQTSMWFNLPQKFIKQNKLI